MHLGGRSTGRSQSRSWGPLAKVSLSAKFGVAVFKASMLDSLWGPSAKVGSSAKFGVVVFQASILNYLGKVSIFQSMFICQVLCTGIQGKYHLSELKSLIVIWGAVSGVSKGVTSDITVQC